MACTDIIMAGFGGQGLLAIGKILAKAAMDEGRNVTWLPSYGPEMRGGTASCTVVIDDEPIGSPVVRRSQAAIVMNKQSFDKFEPAVINNGLLVINTSLVDRKAARNDIRVVYVAASELAEKAGNGRAANMVMLGAYAAVAQAVKLETLEHAIEVTFSSKASLIEANIQAFRSGCDTAKKQIQI